MNATKIDTTEMPNARGRFGAYGGRYVPETVMPALRELEKAYAEAKLDASFWEQLNALLANYAGRPTPLYFAENLTRRIGGASIYLKREDLAHTGSHKINNALGQGLLAKRMGKQRIIAETGAGQHGVATATVCALLGLECEVFMGAEDIQRQSLNVFRMRLLGAKVNSVTGGTRTLKDATNEAFRNWVSNISTTYYLIGSVVGPHPYPGMVRDFQAVIGREARSQMTNQAGRLPDCVVACVGGGSNAIGAFHAFLGDDRVQLVGAEAAGHGVATGKHCASLSEGKPGVLHGAYSYLLQDQHGQVMDTHSISAGLDYPGVGPEHSFLRDSGRAEYVSVADQQALEGFQMLTRSEGIIPALESAHAVFEGIRRAERLGPGAIVMINISGRGDKDMHTVSAALGVKL